MASTLPLWITGSNLGFLPTIFNPEGYAAWAAANPDHEYANLDPAWRFGQTGDTTTGWPTGGVADWLRKQWEGTPGGAVMDPAAYAALFTQINPYTSGFGDWLFGANGSGGALGDLYGRATTESPWTGMGAGMIQAAGNYFGKGADLVGAGAAGLGSLIPQMMGAAGSYDPNASFNQFLSLAPQLQGIAMGSTNGMDKLLESQTRDMVRSAVGESSSQFSNLGAGYSSANIDAGHRAASTAGRDAAIALGNTQLGIYNNLLGAAMPLTAANQQYRHQGLMQGYGMGLEGYGALGGLGGTMGALGSGLAGAGGQLGDLGLGLQGLYASLFGGALGAAGGLASPEWVAPPITPGEEGLSDYSIADWIALLSSGSGGGGGGGAYRPRQFGGGYGGGGGGTSYFTP